MAIHATNPTDGTDANTWLLCHLKGTKPFPHAALPNQNNVEEKPRVPDRYPSKRGTLFDIKKPRNEHHMNIDSRRQSRNTIGGDPGDYQSMSSGVTCVLPQKGSGLTPPGNQNFPCYHFS